MMECIIRAIINFIAYLILSFLTVYFFIFMARLLASQVYTISHGEYFIIWIIMAIFIQQVSGDISRLFYKKTKDND